MEGWTIDREQLAWAAGFLDGEGCFYITEQNKRKPPRPRFELGQVHTAVLERFKKVVGFGAPVNGPYTRKQKPHIKAAPMWTYSVSGFEDVQALVALLWTWLGPVKRAQAKSVLQRRVHNGGSKTEFV
jgi:hypothetical protein